MGRRERGSREREEEEKKWSLGGKKVMRLQRDERNTEEKLHDSGVDEREGAIVWASGEENKVVRICIKEI